MSEAAASALEAVLEGRCAKSRCDNCSEKILICQHQGEDNVAQSFYAIVPKIMSSANRFNRDAALRVSANQMFRQPLSQPAELPANIFITQQLFSRTEALCMA